MCVCVCIYVCVCEWERENQGQSACKSIWFSMLWHQFVCPQVWLYARGNASYERTSMSKVMLCARIPYVGVAALYWNDTLWVSYQEFIKKRVPVQTKWRTRRHTNIKALQQALCSVSREFLQFQICEVFNTGEAGVKYVSCFCSDNPTERSILVSLIEKS